VHAPLCGSGQRNHHGRGEQTTLPSPTDRSCGSYSFSVKAYRLPSHAHLLGVAYADHDFFQRCTRVLVMRDQAVERVIAAQDELTEYLDGVIANKLAEPADDLLSRLALEHVATGELSRREAALMATLLLTAGHETTANMIALGTLALLEHPDQLAALRDTEDPALIAGAVEELLRYLTITHSGRRRIALQDIEIDGRTIHAGDGRSWPAKLQVVYGTLYRRVPGLRLAVPLEQIPFKHDSNVYGVYELPVTF
jgi:hypothetical protein